MEYLDFVVEKSSCSQIDKMIQTLISISLKIVILDEYFILEIDSSFRIISPGHELTPIKTIGMLLMMSKVDIIFKVASIVLMRLCRNRVKILRK